MRVCDYEVGRFRFGLDAWLEDGYDANIISIQQMSHICPIELDSFVIEQIEELTLVENSATIDLVAGLLFVQTLVAVVGQLGSVE